MQSIIDKHKRITESSLNSSAIDGQPSQDSVMEVCDAVPVSQDSHEDQKMETDSIPSDNEEPINKSITTVQQTISQSKDQDQKIKTDAGPEAKVPVGDGTSANGKPTITKSGNISPKRPEALTLQITGNKQALTADSNAAVSGNTGPTLPGSRPHSALSSLQAFSSGSSGDNSPSGTDIEEEQDLTSPTSLLTPPKIVITDFSFDEPADVTVTEADPFRGVQQTNAVCHHSPFLIIIIVVTLLCVMNLVKNKLHKVMLMWLVYGVFCIIIKLL